MQTNIFETLPKNEQAYCRNCKHRQPWKCNSVIIQYCTVRTSNRTDNGLLKIKAKNPACWRYEKEE